MKPNFVSIGAGSLALGVALGAFAAHGLRDVLGERELALWETGTRYWLLGAVGVLVYGVWRDPRPAPATPGWLLLGGMVLFAGSLFALSLGAPRGIGAITPFGGLGLIAGFLGFAWAARRP